MNLFEKVKSKLKITFKKSSTSTTLPRSEIIRSSENYYKNESENIPDYDYAILPKLSAESDIGHLHCRHKKRSKRTITARSPSNTIQELYNHDFSWIDKNFGKGFGDSGHEVGYDNDEQRIDHDNDGDMKYSRNGSLKDQDETDIESMFDFDEKPSVKKVSQTEIVRPSEPQQSVLPSDHNPKKYPYKKIIIPKKSISTLLIDDDDKDASENKPKKFYYYKQPSVEKLYNLDLSKRNLAGKVSEYIDDRTLKEMLTIPREYFSENRGKTRSRTIKFGFNFQCKKRKFIRGRKYKMRMKGYEYEERVNGAFNDELVYKNSTTYFPIQRSGISWHKIPISKKEFENLPNYEYNDGYESVDEEIEKDEEHFSRPLQHSRRLLYQNKGILKNASPGIYQGPGRAQTSQHLNEKLDHSQKRNLDNNGISSPYQNTHLTTQHQNIDDLKKSELKVPSDLKNLESIDDFINHYLSTESKKIINGLPSTSSTQEFVNEQNVQSDNQSMGDGIALEKQRSSISKSSAGRQISRTTNLTTYRYLTKEFSERT